MKVFLCTPPLPIKTKTIAIPVGIGYIAGVLAEKGHEVEIYDSYLYNATFERLIDRIKRSDPDIVGISCNVADRLYALETANLVKEEFNDKLVIIGGPWATFCDKEILENSRVDIVVRNEGEYSLLEIAEGKELEAIKGISFKRNNRIIINEPREFIKDLNTLPRIPFELYDYKKYPNLIKEEKLFLDKEDIPKYTVNLVFGRGCPYNCLFCSSKEFWKRNWRIISPERAVEQISWFVDKGVNGFGILDDHLLLNKKWFSDFTCLLRKEKLDIKYKCSGRLDSINKATVNQLADSGCLSIVLGIESGSQRVLDLMNKGTRVKDTEKVVKQLYEKKIRLRCGFLLNTPGEEFSDIRMSLGLMARLRSKYKVQTGYVNILQIYPGSDLEKLAIKQGKFNNFKWTEHYFNRKNLLFFTNPSIPIYENKPLCVLWQFLFKEFIKMRNPYFLGAWFKGTLDYLTYKQKQE